jgi:nucleoside phosphorylase
VPLAAQGNVLAGAQLAEFFTDHDPPDYVVFYGCAGALDPADANSVFLVQHANYLSLGTVERSAGPHEKVTLKNKWLCHVTPREVDPLESVSFPMTMPTSGLDLCAVSDIPPARVAATDKVLRIGLGVAPTPVSAGPPHAAYAKAEWSYGEALALVAQAGDAVIVEMESYGIGRIARALKFDERVVVLRVTTDSLEDHANSDHEQRNLLERGRAALGLVLAILLARTRFVP